MIYSITFKCGHTAPSPPKVTTDTQARNYQRWAKGQGLCLNCLSEKQMDQAFIYAKQHLYAELEGTFKQVRWALTIRQNKLTEMDLAQRKLFFYSQEPERRERILRAHDHLAHCTQATTWIAASGMSMEELVERTLDRLNILEMA